MVETTGAITGVLRAVNRAWRELEPDAIAPALRPLFCDDATMVGPRFAAFAEGREASIASYADFARAAVVTDFRMEEPSVRLSGETAIATYRWRIVYDLDTTHYDETGHDVVVLRRDGDAWRVLWRAMLADR